MSNLSNCRHGDLSSTHRLAYPPYRTALAAGLPYLIPHRPPSRTLPLAVLQDDQQEEIDSLQSDFARLRESIRTELGASGVGLPPSQAWTKMVEQPAKVSLLPVQHERTFQPQAEVRRAVFEQPELPPAAEPSFYALRESLLGGRTISHMDERPPANTVRLAHSPAMGGMTFSDDDKPTAPACASADDDASLQSEFESLRAAITSQLRDTTSQGFSAIRPPSFVPQATGRATPAWAAAEADAQPVTRAHVQTVAHDTVVLNARKPGCEGGPSLLTAMDAANAAAESVTAKPPRPATLSSAHFSELFDQSSVAFGYAAMQASLESHRRHYEASRAQIRAAYSLPKEKDATPRAVTSGKPSAPVLATAARGRAPKDGAERTVAMLQEELFRLRKGRWVHACRISPPPSPHPAERHDCLLRFSNLTRLGHLFVAEPLLRAEASSVQGGGAGGRGRGGGRFVNQWHRSRCPIIASSQ